MNYTEGKWNKDKMWLAPIAALVFWVTSVVCFVFGLAFKNPLLVRGVDISIWITFALAIANTIVQLIGNGKKSEDVDTLFWAIWMSSYILGISSNVNTLIQILDLNNPVLEWAVALSLGSMIEIAPEKMIIIWLKSNPFKSEPKPAQNTFKPK